MKLMYCLFFQLKNLRLRKKSCNFQECKFPLNTRAKTVNLDLWEKERTSAISLFDFGHCVQFLLDPSHIQIPICQCPLHQLNIVTGLTLCPIKIVNHKKKCLFHFLTETGNWVCQKLQRPWDSGLGPPNTYAHALLSACSLSQWDLR